MRPVSRSTKCGAPRPWVGAISVGVLFPAAPTHTSSAAPWKPLCSRTVCAGLRTTTTRLPSGDQTGDEYIALAGVSSIGLPADAAILYKWPPSLVHVTNASHLPSGDHAGSASFPSRSLTRRGVPPG